MNPDSLTSFIALLWLSVIGLGLVILGVCYGIAGLENRLCRRMDELERRLKEKP